MWVGDFGCCAEFCKVSDGVNWEGRQIREEKLTACVGCVEEAEDKC